MAVPVCTAGVDQSWAYSTLPKTVTLAGAATGSPTAWRWDMLSVPPGSTANVGTNGGFTGGVATTQNPSFTCDVKGCYVLQLKAQNAEGWSDPDAITDREGAQTAIYITTQALAVKLPGYKLYKYDGDLNQTLIDLEGILADHDARHKHGGADEIATATPAANAIPKADGSSKLDGWITANAAAGTASLRQLGTGATDACAGNDSRLSDARTPTAHDLAGAEHNSDTLADLNSKISDANLGTPVTASASGPVSLSANDSGSVYTNEGASAGEVEFDLPAAAANLNFSFIVQDTDGIKVVAAAGDTIRVAGSATPAAGNITAAAIGDSVKLVAINATEWIAFSYVGTWTVSV